MKRCKTETLLGFSKRAGKIIFGTDNILESRSRKYLILYDASLSQNAVKKLESFAVAAKIPIQKTSRSLSDMLNKPSVKTVALLDAHMASAIKQDVQAQEATLIP